MRRAVITGVHLQPQGFKLLLEILVRGNIRSTVEIPFHFGQRHGGKSKANFRVGLDYLVLLDASPEAHSHDQVRRENLPGHRFSPESRRLE